MKKLLVIVFLNFLLILSGDLIAGHYLLKSQNRQYYSEKKLQELISLNRVWDSMYHHGFVPNTSINYHWNNGRWYELYVNSLGLVDKSVREISKTSDKKRVLFLGDSYTEGVGFPYEETFVGILAKTLGEEKYEMLNAGVQGYSPTLYLQKAKFLLDNMKIEVDDAVVMLDLSDIHNEYYEFYNMAYSGDSNILGETTKIPVNSITENISGFFIDNSMIVNYIYDRIVNRNILGTSDNKLPYVEDYQAWTYDKEQYNAFGEKGLELCRKRMVELVEYLRLHNVKKITLVVYPWPQQIKHDDLNSIQETYWSKFSEEQNIEFVNLFPEFFKQQKEIDLFISDSHFSGEGHKLVARELVKLIN